MILGDFQYIADKKKKIAKWGIVYKLNPPIRLCKCYGSIEEQL